MFRRILLTAVLAGGFAGLFAGGLQQFTTSPLILQAEVYEQAAEEAAHAKLHEEADAQGHEHSHGPQAWSPTDGVERISFTLAAELLAGIGFALLLVGAMALSGRDIKASEGAIWGVAGYAVFTLAPSLGLPPELPGMLAADLGARQAWWLGTVLATAGGLALLVFPSRLAPRLAGGVVLAVPHLVGAPHGAVGGLVPPELMAHFASASMVTAGLFWIVLGSVSASIFRRTSLA